MAKLFSTSFDFYKLCKINHDAQMLEVNSEKKNAKPLRFGQEMGHTMALSRICRKMCPQKQQGQWYEAKEGVCDLLRVVGWRYLALISKIKSENNTKKNGSFPIENWYPIILCIPTSEDKLIQLHVVSYVG